MDNVDTKAVWMQELDAIKIDLAAALDELRDNIWQKLKPDERKLIESEIRQVDALITRLQSGLIWVALFGKTAVGKSSIINSLLGDDKAPVQPTHDTTRAGTYYEKKPWILVDMPGTMGDAKLEERAINEANEAHGLIFVIDGEPFADEMELFEKVHNVYPDRPTIVFVNKLDVLNISMPKESRQAVRDRIEQKMGKFVKSLSDIVYGNAQLYNAANDEMIRQELPQLLERLYEDSGELGIVTNLLDPSHRATTVIETVQQKILEIRTKVARKFIIGYAISVSIATTFIPFSTFFVTPFLLESMIIVVFKTMGQKQKVKLTTENVFGQKFIKACLSCIIPDILFTIGSEIVFDTANGTIVGLPLGLMGNAILGFRKAKIMATLGEAAIEYIKDGQSWEGYEYQRKIRECRKRVEEIYDFRRILNRK